MYRSGISLLHAAPALCIGRVRATGRTAGLVANCKPERYANKVNVMSAICRKEIGMLVYTSTLSSEPESTCICIHIKKARVLALLLPYLEVSHVTSAFSRMLHG